MLQMETVASMKSNVAALIKMAWCSMELSDCSSYHNIEQAFCYCRVSNVLSAYYLEQYLKCLKVQGFCLS